ncbi:hypothetical protein RR49_01134 [Microbacterium ginsengisoli]|uniref:Uncharacterized protein n=1 Tax=Microbacterium ginsengisoli TaxID=400772 RepID=A0A0F0LWE7_9MICO|nr:hypothetical protein RR49_01134 [Microbacterium ginsengisoli]
MPGQVSRLGGQGAARVALGEVTRHPLVLRRRRRPSHPCREVLPRPRALGACRARQVLGDPRPLQTLTGATTQIRHRRRAQAQQRRRVARPASLDGRQPQHLLPGDREAPERPHDRVAIRQGDGLVLGGVDGRGKGVKPARVARGLDAGSFEMAPGEPAHGREQVGTECLGRPVPPLHRLLHAGERFLCEILRVRLCHALRSRGTDRGGVMAAPELPPCRGIAVPRLQEQCGVTPARVVDHVLPRPSPAGA